MASLEITTSRTILFSKTDVFFVSIKKNISDIDKQILIWFDNNSTSKPEYWNIERLFNCDDYLSELNAFTIYAPDYEDNNDVISIAFSLKQIKMISD